MWSGKNATYQSFLRVHLQIQSVISYYVMWPKRQKGDAEPLLEGNFLSVMYENLVSQTCFLCTAPKYSWDTEHFRELWHENFIGRQENRISMLFLQKLRQRTPISNPKHYNPNIYRYWRERIIQFWTLIGNIFCFVNQFGCLFVHCVCSSFVGR